MWLSTLVDQCVCDYWLLLFITTLLHNIVLDSAWASNSLVLSQKCTINLLIDLFIDWLFDWFCCFRLAETKASVVEALADDFDTPRAVNALMNLVHHANCQLQPVSKVTTFHVLGGKRLFPTTFPTVSLDFSTRTHWHKQCSKFCWTGSWQDEPLNC